MSITSERVSINAPPHTEFCFCFELERTWGAHPYNSSRHDRDWNADLRGCEISALPGRYPAICMGWKTVAMFRPIGKAISNIKYVGEGRGRKVSVSHLLWFYLEVWWQRSRIYLVSRSCHGGVYVAPSTEQPRAASTDDLFLWTCWGSSAEPTAFSAAWNYKLFGH